MSRRWCLLFAIVASVTSSPDSASGQTGRAQQARRLQARIDSLTPLFMVAESTWRRESAEAQAEMARKLSEHLDTGVVGPFFILARPAAFARASQAFASGWDEIEPWTRGAIGRFPPTVVMVQIGDRVPVFSTMQARPYHVQLDLSTLLPEKTQHVQVARLLGAQLTAAAPSQIRTWLQGIPLSRENGDTQAYRELVTARAHVARECFEWKITSCRRALGVEPSFADWSNWYTPEELRTIVETLEWGHGQLANECVRQRMHSSCVSYLTALGGAPDPMSAAGRLSFLRYVLVRGGTGSFARLFDHEGIEASLVAAGQAPLDTLLRGWRTEVEGAKPDMQSGATGSRLATLFWLMVFAGLAMRSTRWRLG